MIPRRYLLIVNPKAGRTLRRWPELERQLEQRHLSYDTLFSDSIAETLEHLRGLPEDVAVVAVGGDGTIRSLLPALIGSARPLGLIPLGRGNDLAAALGWRVGDLEDAVTRLSLPPKKLDVLEVQVAGKKHYSLNGVGMGFDAQVTAMTARMPRVLGGFGQYALGALSSVAGLRAYGLEVRVDDDIIFEGDSFLAAVMNGTRYGGGFYISPDSRPDDGLADVLVGAQVSRLALLPLMAKVLRGKHLGHERVTHVQGRRVTLRWAEPLPLHLDGDLYPPTDRLEVQLLPKAIKLLSATVKDRVGGGS